MNMNMNKIYELMLKGFEITDELLKSNGYTEDRINKLVSGGLLVKEDGCYYPNNVDNLYNYYKVHIKSLSLEQQAYLLDYTIYLKPTHVGALFQRFYVSLKQGDNQSALNAFAQEYNIKKNDKYSNDSKLQLYLLSKLINVGSELYEEIAGLTYDDIKIHKNDYRYKNVDKHNRARREIMKGNYENAVNMLYNDGSTEKITFQELVFKTLLNRIVNAYRHGHNYKECILDGRYGDALYSINLKEALTDYEGLVKYLLEFLINPPAEIDVDYEHEPGLWESVKANDFECALRLNRVYNLDKGIDENDSALSILLNEIIYMISTFTQEVDEEIVEETPVVEEQHEIVEEITEEPVVEEERDERIDKLQFIVELINQGLSFEEALYHACYDEATNGYITLMYAKEAYRKGNVKMGDKLMSMYNHSTYKNQDNNTLYKRINESKIFLPYRQSDLPIDITLPKKLTRNK